MNFIDWILSKLFPDEPENDNECDFSNSDSYYSDRELLRETWHTERSIFNADPGLSYLDRHYEEMDRD